MKRRALLLTVAIAAMFAVTASAADKYMVDTSHSTVEFGVKHMVVTKVKGKFTEYSGQAMFDAADVTQSSVEVTIMTASVDTGNEKRDSDLRGEGFFTSAEFPEMTFKSTKITKDGDDYIAHGKLTIRGVSKDVQIAFEQSGPIDDPWGNRRFGIAGKLKINRKDYGLTWDKKIADGSLIVADDVNIELNIEFVMAKEKG